MICLFAYCCFGVYDLCLFCYGVCCGCGRYCDCLRVLLVCYAFVSLLPGKVVLPGFVFVGAD